MIPRPKHCDQNWLNMEKVEGGRVCGDCNKLMTDFTKKSWSEIERIHTESKEPVCGMYSKKQLNNWGYEPPSFLSKCTKTTALISSILAVTNFNSLEAKPLQISNKVVQLPQVEIEKDTIPIKPKPALRKISGTVYHKKTKEPLPECEVYIQFSRVLQTKTDSMGIYEITLPEDYSLEDSKPLMFAINYCKPAKRKLNESSINKALNAYVNPNIPDPNVSAFGFSEPTKKQKSRYHFSRIKDWFKNLF